MQNIKISFPGHGKDRDISQFTGETDNIFKDKKFWINSDIEESDYWFVFEDLNKLENNQTKIDKRNVVFLSAETSWPEDYYFTKSKKDYLNQFQKIYLFGLKTPEDISTKKIIIDLPFLPWMINANHGDSYLSPNKRDLTYFKSLEKLNKRKTLSVICSNKNNTDFHSARFDFVKKIKKHFGEDIDWYGNGINEIETKWEGIADYKYHICIENKSKKNLITEKLFDSFLGLSLPIYYGAPNVSNYFSEDSFVSIDISDIDESIKTISNLLNNDPYDEKIDSILESKNMVCTEYNVFNRISNIVDLLNKENYKNKELIHLKSKGHYEVLNKEVKVNRTLIFYRKIKQRIKKILNL